MLRPLGNPAHGVPFGSCPTVQGASWCQLDSELIPHVLRATVARMLTCDTRRPRRLAPSKRGTQELMPGHKPRGCRHDGGTVIDPALEGAPRRPNCSNVTGPA